MKGLRYLRLFSAAGLGSLLSMLPASPAAAAEPAPACTGPEYALLDFWLGDWDVYAGDKKVGQNRISKALGGCAVREQWTSGPYLGESLFFYQPLKKQWKQIWLTNTPDSPGGIKEKYLQKAEPGRMTHFEGEWSLADGTRVLDRTFLARNDDGSVRQVIETSRDGGKTWKTGFDAIYKARR